MHQADVIVLLSGGLDSLLCAKLLQEQGLSVLGVHMVSPFFGDKKKCPFWERQYGIRVLHRDISNDFVAMLRNGPKFGFGKTLNPCVDCKILLLREAKKCMEEYGAKAIASGAVVGQRPMSQRRDVMNTILREADVKDCLIRPLSAHHLPPTKLEENGFIDRSKLLGISGRGRKEQLQLAKERYHFQSIPSPGGGCKLTEHENARRYWMVLHTNKSSDAQDFYLANTGRQYWQSRGDEAFWLSLGRNKNDNEILKTLKRADDSILFFPHIPSPIALARHGRNWPNDLLLSAARLTLSYAVKALTQRNKATLRLETDNSWIEETIEANRQEAWSLPPWETIRKEIRASQKKESKENDESNERSF
ncbi:MAG: tRNA(5-methylaminomethyl-2-thiouridylate) methyltransferase [Desulfovibrio sp.]|nr:tRNA(5-methylaminomethyl-2-thiouridylate) methyltransferase [Desulfovibrio sp.]